MRSHSRCNAAVALLLAALALGGCASMSKKDCLSGAWYEQGFEDATEGLDSGRFADHVKACGKVGVMPDRRVYASGYESGLTEYCTAERGYRIGSDNGDYRDICPGALEAAFLGGYLDGLEAALVTSEFESANAEIDLERAVSERAALPPDSSTKKADARVDGARDTLERLRTDRFEINGKISRWRTELSGL